MMKRKKIYKSGIFAVTILLTSYFLFLTSPVSQAQTIEEIQSKINTRNQDIANLEKEIEGYSRQIEELGSQADTLSSTLKSLQLTRKKLETDIALTQEKIAAKNYEIQSLSNTIDDKEKEVSDAKRIIVKTFATIAELDDKSVPEIILGSRSLSGAWDSLDQLALVQKNLYDRIDEINVAKADLENNKKKSETAKRELQALSAKLSDQRAIVLDTTAEQNALLKETKNSEASYKQILASKKAQEAALREEISSYESQLHLLVNPSLIPHTGTGVLAWPLDKVFITQYFGNTPFATANPQVYSGKGHNGVDFRASIGTPVKAALSGIVAGTGDTGLVKSCLSYGRWVMIKHDNGLSTLYAHLSLVGVEKGQKISTGQIIGYSGNTGYSTGPHLHFGVYATQGVRIEKFANSINCHNVVLPLADPQAYLNPLSYL